MDRWGKAVFRSASLADTWDGTIGGARASAGTYFYIIRYTPSCTQEAVELHGHVTLLR